MPALNLMRHTIVGLALLSAAAACMAAEERVLPFRAETTYYIIETDVSQDFADDIGDFMEVLYAAYLKVFRDIQPRWTARLRVRILKNREDYVEEVGEKLSWSGGVYRGRNRGILTCLGKGTPSGVKHVLQHEGLHQFFDKFIGGGAVWVNEGLATYFGSGIVEGDEIKLGAVRARTLNGVRAAMEKGSALSLKDVVLITGAQWVDNMNEDEKPPQYAQVMLLIHFLVHGYGGRNIPVLNDYLLLLKKGIRGEEALKKAFGANFGLFEKKWTDYVLELKPGEPPSCTRNLERLAMLVRFSRNGPGVPGTIEELHELAVAGKIKGWRLTLPDGRAVTAADGDEIETWFHCPEVKMKAPIPYELEPPEQEGGYPDIICRHHGKYLLRARIKPRPDGKGDYTDVETERRTTRKK